MVEEENKNKTSLQSSLVQRTKNKKKIKAVINLILESVKEGEKNEIPVIYGGPVTVFVFVPFSTTFFLVSFFSTFSLPKFTNTLSLKNLLTALKKAALKQYRRQLVPRFVLFLFIFLLTLYSQSFPSMKMSYI